MKILIVTGGTGGHIYPALALADYIKEQRHADILFVGNDDRMEANIIPSKGYAFSALHTSGFSGSLPHKVKALTQSALAYQKAKKLVKKFNPDIVIGFGGYVSVPVIMAAHKLHKKIILHEQNSIAGAANKMLAKYANAIVVCYEKCKQEFEHEQVYLLGNPRATLAAKNNFDELYFDSLKLRNDKPLGLVVMGSLGSSSIDQIMAEVLKDVDQANFLYVSGKKGYEFAKEKLESEHVKVVEYVDQLSILDHFDFIICRAGATTAAEVSAKGICSILIPSPYVAHNHQYYNAKALVDDGSALMIEEKDLNSELLCDRINMILNDEKLRMKMSEQAKKHSFPNACEDILKLIENI